MKRFLGFLAVLAAIGLFQATTTQAQMSTQSTLGPHLGLDLSGGTNVFLGGNGRFPIGTLGSNPLLLNPQFDLYFPEVGTAFVLNGNLLLAFSPLGAGVVPYAGAGLAIQYASAFGVSDTDLGLNLTGGALFNTGGLQPWVGGVIKVGGGTALKIVGGLSFPL